MANPTQDTERMELVAWLTGIIDNSHIDGNTRSAMVKARDLIQRDGERLAEYADEQTTAQLMDNLCAAMNRASAGDRRIAQLEAALDGVREAIGDSDETAALAIIKTALASKPEPQAPVTLEEIQDPDFTGGLSPTEYLDRLHAGTLGDIQSQAPESKPPAPDYDHLAKTTFWPAEKPPAEKDGETDRRGLLTDVLAATDPSNWDEMHGDFYKGYYAAMIDTILPIVIEYQSPAPNSPRVKHNRRYPGDPESSRKEHLADHLSVHQQADGQPAPSPPPMSRKAEQ